MKRVLWLMAGLLALLGLVIVIGGYVADGGWGAFHGAVTLLYAVCTALYAHTADGDAVTIRIVHQTLPASPDTPEDAGPTGDSR